MPNSIYVQNQVKVLVFLEIDGVECGIEWHEWHNCFIFMEANIGVLLIHKSNHAKFPHLPGVLEMLKRLLNHHLDLICMILLFMGEASSNRMCLLSSQIKNEL